MYKKAETSSTSLIFIFSSSALLLCIAMPTTRRSKAIKTPEFIKSDAEDSDGSADYEDTDKYVSIHLFWLHAQRIYTEIPATLKFLMRKP